MQLAIVSYPYHYHITQLAIKHVLDNIHGITDVKIIWDDRMMPAPNNDCIPFSKIYPIPHNIKGWYAQQVIKLNLHNVMQGDIFVIDGDVILNESFDPFRYFYAPHMGDRSKAYSLVKTLLNIEQYNFINAPFMFVNSLWLKELHKCNSDINKIYFDTALSNWTEKGEWPISEWELLYVFLTQIKKIDKTVVPFWFNMLDTTAFEQKFNTNENFILAGKDNFSIDFYDKHNIKINETIWKQLYGALV